MTRSLWMPVMGVHILLSIPLHENFISEYIYCLFSPVSLTSYISRAFSLMTVEFIELLTQDPSNDITDYNNLLYVIKLTSYRID